MTRGSCDVTRFLDETRGCISDYLKNEQILFQKIDYLVLDDNEKLNSYDIERLTSHPTTMLYLFANPVNGSYNYNILEERILYNLRNYLSHMDNIIDYYLELLYEEFGEDDLYVLKNTYLFTKLSEIQFQLMYDIHSDSGYNEYSIDVVFEEIMQKYKEYNIEDRHFYLTPSLINKQDVHGYPPSPNMLGDINYLVEACNYKLSRIYDIIEDEMSSELESENKIFDISNVYNKVCRRFRNDIIEVLSHYEIMIGLNRVDTHINLDNIDFDEFVTRCMYSDDIWSVGYGIFNNTIPREIPEGYYKGFINQAIWLQRIIIELEQLS